MSEVGMEKLSLDPPKSPPKEPKELPEPQALRPDIGKLGIKTTLRANYVKLSKFPNLKIFQYNYLITSAASKRKPGKKVRWNVFLEIVKKKIFGNCLAIFDRNDLIYSSTKFPFEKKDFKITLPPTEDSDKSTDFDVTVKLHKELSLQTLKDYVESNANVPKQLWDNNVQMCIHALNTYINYKVRTEYLFVGRGIYPPSDREPIMLSGGAELKQGFCQSLRPGWNDVVINVDVCSNMFCPPGNVVDFAAAVLRRRPNDLRRGIDDKDRKLLYKALKGIRFRVTHRENARRSKYTVEDISRESAERIKFRDEENRETSVAQFFANKYRRLEFASLPCLIVGKDKKNSYPLEVCEILPDQPFKGDISDEGRADMIKYTCVRPNDRFRAISNSFQNVFRYGSDEYLKSINMDVNTSSMMNVDGRMLPPVSLAFKNKPTHKIDGGRWNYVGQIIQDGKKLVNWSALVLSGDHPDQVRQFTRQLRETLNKKGMNIVNDPQIMTYPHQRDIKQGLIQAIDKARISKDEPPQLILVVMRERSSLYSDIKRTAETVLGVRTQCVLSRNLRKPKGLEQFCVNLGLKINAKLGGKNCSLAAGQIDFITSVPTMVFGADVFHSGVNEQSHPSIAAVCASMDPSATIYSGRYSLNEKPRNETIEKLDEMVISLLKAFRTKNGRLPQRILFYRDGVSEGQFRTVMDEEVKAMRKAFKGGYGDNPPKLTFIIVQKRHHTRFMPASQRDGDRNGNCKAGVVVDTGIVVKQEFDFFLQAHATLQGTGRPTHYRVLVDDNKFKADEMQSLTNKLCYLNARCTAAISVVTPAFYAHLIANRARHYTIWDGKTSSEGQATCANVITQLSNIMYFI